MKEVDDIREEEEFNPINNGQDSKKKTGAEFTLEELSKIKEKRRVDELMKDSSANTISNMVIGYNSIMEGTPEWHPFVADKGEKTNPVIEITDMDSPTIQNAFNPEDEMSVTDVTNMPVKIYAIKDKKKQEEYTKTVTKYLDRQENYVNRQADDNKISRKTGDFMLALHINGTRRAVKGWQNARLGNRTPFGGGVQPVYNALLGFKFDDKVEERLTSIQKDFPVVDAVIESDKMVGNLVDYYSELEKPFTKMSPEKEEEYRKTIRDRSKKLAVYLDKMDETLKDPEKEKMIKDSGICPSNHPFELSSMYSRGHGFLKHTVNAYADGLDSGWSVKDCGALAGFKIMLEEEKQKIHTNAGETTTQYSLLKTYDKPHYKGWRSEEERDRQRKNHQEQTIAKEEALMKEHENFLGEMDNLYRKMTSGRPEPKGEILNGYLDLMQDMVNLGVKKDFLQRDRKEYFDNLILNIRAGGLSFTAKDLTADVLKTNIGLTKGNETPQHKEFRQSAKSLLAFAKKYDTIKNEKPGLTKEELEVFGENYLLQMDETINQTRKYRWSGADSSIPEAGERKAAFVELEEKLIAERKRVLKEMKENGLFTNCRTFGDVRRSAATRRMNEAEAKISQMNGLPKDIKGIEKLMHCSADILVGRMATGNSEIARKIVRTVGIKDMKRQIFDDKDFRAMVVKKLSVEGMTPKRFTEEMVRDLPITKLKSLKKNQEKREKLQGKELQEQRRMQQRPAMRK